MKYHTLFVIFEKKRQNLKLQSAVNYIGGALRVNTFPANHGLSSAILSAYVR